MNYLIESICRYLETFNFQNLIIERGGYAVYPDFDEDSNYNQIVVGMTTETPPISTLGVGWYFYEIYVKHQEKLKAEGIITRIHNQIINKRGYFIPVSDFENSVLIEQNLSTEIPTIFDNPQTATVYVAKYKAYTKNNQFNNIY